MISLRFSSRILRFSCEKPYTFFSKTAAEFRHVFQERSIVQASYSVFPKYEVNTKNLFCKVCGNFNPSFRTFSTSQLLLKKIRKNKKREPVVFSKTKSSKGPPVSIWKNMTVRELAAAVDKTIDELYEVFLYLDNTEDYDRPNKVINDFDVIQGAVRVLGKRFDVKSSIPPSEDIQLRDAFKSPPAPPGELEPRPPIVTIMGHVDHGKTTLLDYLRKSSIVDSEFGGITQHIGAFEVMLPNGKQVTFLDTPGHAAFSAMRARGANVTDIIVLVVAAEDGALQQTKESADLARATNTPIVVAINKIDKPDANVRKCEESLISIGVQPESMGGDSQVVTISALKGTNVPVLVEALATLAEILELKATRKGLSEGTVIESEVHSGKGKIATCIVQRGTLKKGSVIVADTAWAKVRNLFNSHGSAVSEALPGSPVQVTGWKNKIPSAGAEFLEVDGEKRAKEVISIREKLAQKKKDESDLEAIQQKMEEHTKAYSEFREKKLQMGIRRKLVKGRAPLEKEIKEDTQIRLRIVLKGDVDGSVDAILDLLDTYHSEECPLDLLGFGVGSVNPSDIDLAKAFNGIIYTFNLPLATDMKYLAIENKVPIHQHNIIYRLIEDLQDEISERLPPLPEEEVLGEAEVQQVFMINEGKNKVPVAGCRCVSGALKKVEKFKVIRSTETLFEGELRSLKHLKREVEIIKKDVECGLMLNDPKINFQPGDKIVCYQIKMVNRRTDWNPT